MSRACGSSVQCEVRDAQFDRTWSRRSGPLALVTSVTRERGRPVKFSIFGVDCQWGRAPGAPRPCSPC